MIDCQTQRVTRRMQALWGAPEAQHMIIDWPHGAAYKLEEAGGGA